MQGVQRKEEGIQMERRGTEGQSPGRDRGPPEAEGAPSAAGTGAQQGAGPPREPGRDPGGRSPARARRGEQPEDRPGKQWRSRPAVGRGQREPELCSAEGGSQPGATSGAGTK